MVCNLKKHCSREQLGKEGLGHCWLTAMANGLVKVFVRSLLALPALPIPNGDCNQESCFVLRLSLHSSTGIRPPAPIFNSLQPLLQARKPSHQ